MKEKMKTALEERNGTISGLMSKLVILEAACLGVKKEAIHAHLLGLKSFPEE